MILTIYKYNVKQWDIIHGSLIRLWYILPDGKFISYNNSLYYNDNGYRLKLPTKEEITLWNTVGNISHIRQTLTINIPQQITSYSTATFYTCPQTLDYIGWCIYFSMQYRWYGTVTVSGSDTSCAASASILPNSDSNQTTIYSTEISADIPHEIESVVNIGYIKSNYGDSLKQQDSNSIAPFRTPFKNNALFKMRFDSQSYGYDVKHNINCDITIDYLTVLNIAWWQRNLGESF